MNAAVTSILRGDDVAFLEQQNSTFWQRLLVFSRIHGVEALLFERLTRASALSILPPDVVAELKQIAHVQAARELVVKREIVELLQRLSSEKIDFVLLKGAPLAYTFYSAPYLRTRGDTDVWIADSQRKLAHKVLTERGYQSAIPYARGAASYQLSYTLDDEHHISRHVVDLHWRLSNTQLFSRALSFAEILASATQVPALGRNAPCPCPVHALVIACLHRATHINAPYTVNGIPYFEANRLIWLYDIYLLTNAFGVADWTQFLDLVKDRHVCAVCLDGLLAAQRNLGAQIPPDVLAQLGLVGLQEPSAAYLRRGVWRRRLFVDLPAMPSWSDRIGLVVDWVLPPQDHLFKKYDTNNPWLLPFLYIRRFFGGIRKALLSRHAD